MRHCEEACDDQQIFAKTIPTLLQDNKYWAGLQL